ncbi:MAG: Uma2 family endonuclease [Gemmataceae bacterium]|nr:Uma2 family endonuclease [Gemmataceae bacterium]
MTAASRKGDDHMSSVAKSLLTVEEYARLPDSGQYTELVRGRVVKMNPPKPRHGQICNKVGRIFGVFADEHDLGHVLSNDSGVITERDPDTLRGADIAFYSYAKVPKGPLSNDYLPVPPDLIIEVRSENDRWTKVVAKVGEYLNAGVAAVCVLDDTPPIAYVYRPDQRVQVFAADDDLVLPGILPGFSVKVRRFFE